jgi:hypothetical protein
MPSEINEKKEFSAVTNGCSKGQVNNPGQTIQHGCPQSKKIEVRKILLLDFELFIGGKKNLLNQRNQ